MTKPQSCVLQHNISRTRGTLPCGDANDLELVKFRRRESQGARDAAGPGATGVTVFRCNSVQILLSVWCAAGNVVHRHSFGVMIARQLGKQHASVAQLLACQQC